MADLHVTVASRLRQVDQRYTRNRQRLVEVLEAAGRPLAIHEIVASRPGLPQSSVYRNLAVLEQAGAVHRVTGADEFARYELAEDLTGHHHHLVCVGCGDVSDFTVPDRLERAMQRAIAGVRADRGFEPQAHRLDLVGLCGGCQDRPASSGSAT